jgi:hypothetical protein
MSKNLRTAMVAFMSVVLAGVSLEYDWGLYASLGAVVAGVLLGYFCGWMARWQLPTNPRRWAIWISGREAIYDSVVVLFAAAALYLAIEWGKDVEKIDADLTGLAAFGAIAGVAFVKVLDEVAGQSDWIDKRVEKFAKTMFRNTYEPMLESGDLDKKTAVQGREVYSQAYHAVHTDEKFDGWSKEGRAKRADLVAKALS